MRRRTVLGSVGLLAGAASGCAGIPALSESGYAITEFSVDTEKISPTHEYAIFHTGVHGESQKEYTYYDEIDQAIVEVLHRARESERGLHRTDDLPGGLEGVLDAHDRFLDADDAHGIDPYDRYELCELDPDAPAALEFEAILRDDVVTGDDPAPIEFSITNTSEQTRYIVGGANPPLGLLTAEGSESDRSFVLWTDYEGISVTNEGIERQMPGTYTPVAPGDTITETYELRAGTADEEPGEGLGPGTYTVSDRLAYTRQENSDCPAEVVEWNVTFTVEQR